ncbi:tyrosine kinase family protein, partial [Chlamydia psittaci 06-1683]
GSLSFAIGSFP